MHIFDSEKEFIFNNPKQEQASGDSDLEQSYEDWRKLPRGWFSTKNYQGSHLCIRHATSMEFINRKWTILISPLEEDLIFRVNLLASTLQTEALL